MSLLWPYILLAILLDSTGAGENVHRIKKRIQVTREYLISLYTLLSFTIMSDDANPPDLPEVIADVEPHDPNETTNENCPICANDWDDLAVEGQPIVTTTKCRHSFHESCLRDWLISGQNTCPLCRETLFRFPDGYVHQPEESENEDEGLPYTTAEYIAAIEVLRVNDARMVRYIRQWFFREMRRRRRKIPGPPGPLVDILQGAYWQYRNRTRGRSRNAIQVAEHYPFLVMGRALLALARERNLADDTSNVEEIVRAIEEDESMPNGD